MVNHELVGVNRRHGLRWVARHDGDGAEPEGDEDAGKVGALRVAPNKIRVEIIRRGIDGDEVRGFLGRRANELSDVELMSRSLMRPMATYLSDFGRIRRRRSCPRR